MAQGETVSLDRGLMGAALGGETRIVQSAANTVIGRDTTVDQSLVGAVLAADVTVRQPSAIAVLIAGRVEATSARSSTGRRAGFRRGFRDASPRSFAAAEGGPAARFRHTGGHARPRRPRHRRASELHQGGARHRRDRPSVDPPAESSTRVSTTTSACRTCSSTSSDCRVPDVNLGVGSGTHAEQTAAAMIGLEREFATDRPSLVMLYGDVNSTLAGSLAAAKLEIASAHVEAGLRSFDRSMRGDQPAGQRPPGGAPVHDQPRGGPSRSDGHRCAADPFRRQPDDRHAAGPSRAVR